MPTHCMRWDRGAERGFGGCNGGGEVAGDLVGLVLVAGHCFPLVRRGHPRRRRAVAVKRHRVGWCGVESLVGLPELMTLWISQTATAPHARR